MQFNSLDYILFFILVIIIVYYFNHSENILLRNSFILCASYYFYLQIHFWYLLLLLYIIFVSFFGGKLISLAKRKGRYQKYCLLITVFLIITCLLFYKYAYIVSPSILLPIGLSFFTFQSLTYCIDIYRDKIKEDSFIYVALFISFFPTLLSGPIERARNLLPQFHKKFQIEWDSIIIGIKLFIWGIFKKMVIADRLGIYVDEIYYSVDAYSGSTLALASILYSFQIYADFSGYADMAIGSAKMIGINIMNNFNYPYFARTIKDFWRRGHISLTSWFTEYIYISLGGNRVNMYRWIFNITLVFLLSGIWHGATFPFIIWGGLHATYYLFEHFLKIKKPNLLYHIIIFILITIAWIFFRLPELNQSLYVIQHIFMDLNSSIYWGSSYFSTFISIFLLCFYMIREWFMYKKRKSLMSFDIILILLLLSLFGMQTDQFVYFQF